jgi:glucosamine--fructose-6-phosphate aminotransferase (isomerizing)
MCGIFGIVSNNNCNLNILQIILNGLNQLKNRGYDSAGICYIHNNNKDFNIIKYASLLDKNIFALDKIAEYINNLNHNIKDINIGFGHNRWATHGIKNNINAHPHLSNTKLFSIVHNGIIHNYDQLKNFLIGNGYKFVSQTDTEIIVNLIEYHFMNLIRNINELTIHNLNDIINQSIVQTINQLDGTFGCIIQCIHLPNNLYVFRNGSPILIGYTNDICIITSEQSGFENVNLINHYISLSNNDICCVELNKDNNQVNLLFNQSYIYQKYNIMNKDNNYIPNVNNQYPHWTLKEIYEQPNIIMSAINNGGRIKNEHEVKLGGLDINIDKLKNIDNIILLGCGSSYYAGLYGMYFFKKLGLGNFNTIQVIDGADFDITDIPKLGNTAIIFISQSGETRDLYQVLTLLSKYHYKNRIITIGVINVVDSQIAREVDCGVYCNAGKEYGVASTKSFTSQVVVLSLIAIWFSQINEPLTQKEIRIRILKDLNNLSNDFQLTLKNIIENDIIEENLDYLNKKNMFILGKESDEIIAKEGSLKIKEIAYIHAEGYSSSALKHGPFALLDENCPVILLNLNENYLNYNKIYNCYHEINSRDTPILVICNSNSLFINNNDINKIVICYNKSYQSLLGILPLQLIAYKLSIKNNINPDYPKNLAKVVSVE